MEPDMLKAVDEISAAMGIRPEVLKFAFQMERCLREKDAQWGGNSWKNLPDQFQSTKDAAYNLNSHADLRIAEVYASLTNLNFAGAIKSAVDMANFAMMIADVCEAGTAHGANFRMQGEAI